MLMRQGFSSVLEPLALDVTGGFSTKVTGTTPQSRAMKNKLKKRKKKQINNDKICSTIVLGKYGLRGGFPVEK